MADTADDSLYRRTRIPGWLTWFEGWRTASAQSQSAFIKNEPGGFSQLPCHDDSTTVTIAVVLLLDSLLPHARKVLFLALSVTFSFFVCASNISGTAERICTKFTGKTCLLPRSDEFECQGQRSKVKVTRDKTGKTAASSPLTVHCKACAIRCKFCTAADETIPWPLRVTGCDA